MNESASRWLFLNVCIEQGAFIHILLKLYPIPIILVYLINYYGFNVHNDYNHTLKG